MFKWLRHPRSAEGSATRLVRGTVINALSSGAGAFFTLLLTPLLIHRLGTEAYGVWILATTLTFGVGYLSFTDLGLEQAAVRFMAQARASGDVELFNSYLSTAFFALAAITAAVTPVLVLLAHPLTGLFSIPPHLEASATIAFQFVLAQLAFDLPSRAFSAVLESAQRYTLWQLTRIIQAVLVSGLLAYAVLSGGGIAELGRASFAAAAGSFLVTAAVATFSVPGGRLSLRAVNRETWRELRSFSGDLITFRILSSIYRQIDKTVIGIILGASFVTTYEIGNKLYSTAALVQSLATSALVPTVAFSFRHRDRLQDMLLRGTSYTLAVCVPVTIGGFIFASPLIKTWIGSSYGSAVAPARWLLVTLIPSYLIVVGQSMLVGLGRVRPMLWMVATWTVLNLVLSVALAKPLGVIGVVIATLIPSVLLVFPVLRLVLGELAISPRRFIHEALMPSVPALVVQFAVGLPLLLLLGGTHLLPVALAAAGLSAVAGMLAYVFLGLDRRRREALLITVRRAIGVEAEPPLTESEPPVDDLVASLSTNPEPELLPPA
jgi:O-antigen/teichoic acid export membrane protein